MSAKQRKAVQSRIERLSRVLKMVINTDITSTKENWIPSLKNGSWDSRYYSVIYWIEKRIELNKSAIERKINVDRNFSDLVSANID